MKTTHTPIPWHQETWAYDPPRGARFVIKNKEDAIAEMIPLYRPDVKNTRMDEEHANGELICRAVNCHTELLEACKACITNIPDADITKHRDRLAEINGILRAAIEKATA